MIEDLNIRNHKPKFGDVNYENQRLYPTHGVVIKGLCKRFVSLGSNFPKLVANSLLFKVCHFIKLQQSQNILNMNTPGRQLQKKQH